MSQLNELHKDHLELESDLLFYKQEISFLLKIIAPEYSKSVSIEKIKLLDSYWKEFEKYYKKLEQLISEIKEHEYNLSLVYRENFKQMLSTKLTETGIVVEYINLRNALRAVKASLYDFLGNAAIAKKTSVTPGLL
jgi:hypothetical protein